MLLDITSNTRDLPHLALLPAIPCNLLQRPSRPERLHGDSQHCWKCRPQRASGILWHLHTGG